MKKIGEYIKWYFYITTSILMVVALICGVSGAETLSGETLWQILLSGFATTILTVAMIYAESLVSKGMVFVYLCHYISLCAVMIPLGSWFGWINVNLYGILLMIGAVAAVYLLAFGAYYVIDLRAAKKINQRLKEKYGEE